MDEFLCSEDKTILRETLEEFGVSPKEFWRFWSWDELQLDGDFRLLELQALAKAMERIAERHAAQHARAVDAATGAQAEGASDAPPRH